MARLHVHPTTAALPGRGAFGRVNASRRSFAAKASSSSSSSSSDEPEPQVEVGGGSDDGGRRRPRDDGRDWRSWAYNHWENEDRDLRRFLRGQGGDGYTSRGTGDEGLPSTPPPPLRGALGYSARGYEMGGVGGGSPVAAASLRFGQALARTPLRARMVVGGGAYALTDLMAGGSGGAGGFCGVRTAFSQPDPPPSAPPLPTHEAPSAAPAATAPVIAAPAAPAAALTHSPVVVSPGAAGGPSGNGDETPAPWWADWDRRCVHALRSVVVGAAVIAPLLRGADAVLSSLLPYSRSQAWLRAALWHTVVAPGTIGGAWTAQGLLDGHTLSHCAHTITHQLPRTWLLSTLFWVPSHAAVASLLPPQHRPAVLTLVGLLPMVFAQRCWRDAHSGMGCTF